MTAIKETKVKMQSAWPNKGSGLRRGSWKPLLGWLALAAAGAWIAYGAAESSGMQSLRSGAARRLDIYAASLQSEMSRYDYLPSVVSLSPSVAGLLLQPGNRELQARANRHLETVNALAKASAIYVMDTRGITLAASNWNQPPSFVDMDFSYRPYFRDAMAGVAGRFYGIGTVSREPGYYFSEAIRHDGRIVGVVAVKVDLDKLDQTWAHSAEKILVADANGVVFLSSEPKWKYRTLEQLSSDTLARLAQTRQYTEAGSLQPIGLERGRLLADGSSIVRAMRAGGGHDALNQLLASEHLQHNQPVAGTDWTIIGLSDMQPVRSRAQTAAMIAAFALGFLALLWLYLAQRRRNLRERLASREALQQAHDELERKVELRTAALSRANAHLQTEIAERRKAEETLKATLDELTHTGKLAALGQMAAGITHELNQPLAALRTLSANTIVFLERGARAQVESNLQLICQLTDRMGKITSQLKKFARKSAIQLCPVPVADAIDDALFLLDQRLRSERIQLEKCLPEAGLTALCDANRLEQVVVNLVSNAIDAMRGAPSRRLRIVAHGTPEWVTVEVHDSGPGIPPEVQPHLFEPFFTTKEQGAGLGLGLAISAGIARDLGGSLRAGASPLGGASFAIQLRPAADTGKESKP